MNVGDVLTLAGTQGGRGPALHIRSRSPPTSTVSDLENFINQALGINTTVVEAGKSHARARRCRQPAPPPSSPSSATPARKMRLTLGSQGLVDNTTRHNSLHDCRRHRRHASPTIPPAKAPTPPLPLTTRWATPSRVNLTTVLESKTATGGRRLAILRHQPRTIMGGNGPDRRHRNADLQQRRARCSPQPARSFPSTAPEPVPRARSTSISISAARPPCASTASNLVMSTQDGEPIGTPHVIFRRRRRNDHRANSATA